MSGNTNTANNANTADSRFFTDNKRSEFGMRVFSDSYAQATYDFYEDGYRKKMMLKEAFDKQEMLHKMRVDIKREYLTRKKQVKTLQKYAAVEFRNAEMSLQELYASVQASQIPHEYRHRSIDVSAALESRITLSSGEVVDLKTFDRYAEFQRIVGVHASLLHEQKDAEDAVHDEWLEEEDDEEEEEERQCLAASECDAMMEQRLQDRTRTLDFGWVSCESPTTTTTTTTQRSAFGGCYDYTEEELEQERREQEESQTTALGRYFANKWVHLGLRRSLTDEEIAILVAGEKAENAMHEHDYDPSWDYTLDVSAFHAAMRLDELLQQEQTRDVESFTQVLKDHADEELQRDIEQCALELPDEPASEGNIAIPLPLVKAKKPRTATAASATKARIAKQQRKNQGQQQQQQQGQRKYVPLRITINDNRADDNQSEALLAMTSSSKIEINLQKKNLQKVSREAKKHHTKMWHSINAQAKQSAARGTRIADIPRKRSYLDDDSDCDH